MSCSIVRTACLSVALMLPCLAAGEEAPSVDARLQIDAQTDFVRHLTFSPDGALLLTAGLSDGQVLEEDKLRLWHTRDGKLSQVLKAQDIPVVSGFFGHRKELYVAAPRHFQVRFYSVQRGRQIGVLETEQETYRITASPDDKWLATGSKPADEGGSEKTVQLYDFKTGERKFTAELDADNVNLVFSHDGTRLVVGCRSGLVKLFEVPEGKVLQTWEADGDPARRTYAALSPDGKLVAAALDAKTIKLYDTATGKEVRALPTAGTVGNIVFSPDGSRLAAGVGPLPGTALPAPAIEVWNIETANPLARLSTKLHEKDEVAAARVMAFSADGQSLAASYWGPRAYVWGVSDFVPQTETEAAAETAAETAATETNPADEAAQKEKAAESVLKLARRFKASGKIDTAVTWFQKIVKQYPETAAAQEAARELEELGY